MIIGFILGFAAMYILLPWLVFLVFLYCIAWCLYRVWLWIADVPSAIVAFFDFFLEMPMNYLIPFIILLFLSEIIARIQYQIDPDYHIYMNERRAATAAKEKAEKQNR